MKPKIVQLAAVDYSIVKLLSNLNKQAKNEGYEVHILTSKGQHRQVLEKQGYIVHDVNIDRAIKPISNIKSIWKIRKKLREIKPQILHVHTPIASVLARVAAKFTKIPSVIYTAHGFYFHDDMPKYKYKLFFKIEQIIGRYFTDYIFTQSKEDYNLAVKYKFRPANQMVWISNGIDLNDKFNYKKINNHSGLKKSLGFHESEFLVTFIGRLVEEKGLLDLLAATKNLPSNIKVIIIGELPEKERDTTIQNKISHYKNEDNIIFTGQIDNINEYLCISDIFCLPSYREGMPRSIIEAMAMKNAIIATNIRGSREEVIDGVNGFLIDVKRADLIRDKILKLYNNRELLEKMKIESHNRAHTLYNEDDVIEKQLSIFERVIKR